METDELEALRRLPPSLFEPEQGFRRLLDSGLRKVESELFAWLMLRAQEAQGDTWRPVEGSQIHRVLLLDFLERRPETVQFVRWVRGGPQPTPFYLLKKGLLRNVYGDYLEWTDEGIVILFEHLEKKGGLLLW